MTEEPSDKLKQNKNIHARDSESLSTYKVGAVTPLPRKARRGGCQVPSSSGTHGRYFSSVGFYSSITKRPHSQTLAIRRPPCLDLLFLPFNFVGQRCLHQSLGEQMVDEPPFSMRPRRLCRISHHTGIDNQSPTS